jgi:hypothetical protein
MQDSEDISKVQAIVPRQASSMFQQLTDELGFESVLS